MSDGFSAALANALLNVLNGTAPTTYATVYVQLHTADPGTAGTTAVSAGSSTRSSATFGSSSNASNKSTTSLSNTPSWTNGGTPETITDISVWSASTSGTFLFSVQLSASQAWATGNTLQLTSLSASLPSAS